MISRESKQALIHNQKAIMIRSRQRVTDNLSRILTSLASIALTVSFAGAVLPLAGSLSNFHSLPLPQLLLMLLIFVSTLIPFFMGTLKLFENLYAGTWYFRPNPIGFLSSFSALFLTLLPFYLMAGIFYLKEPIHTKIAFFIAAHMVQIGGNVLILTVLICFQLSFVKSRRIEQFWQSVVHCILNSSFVLVGIVLLFTFPLTNQSDDLLIYYCSFAVIRNILDLVLTWDGYFPNPLLIDSKGRSLIEIPRRTLIANQTPNTFCKKLRHKLGEFFGHSRQYRNANRILERHQDSSSAAVRTLAQRETMTLHDYNPSLFVLALNAEHSATPSLTPPDIINEQKKQQEVNLKTLVELAKDGFEGDNIMTYKPQFFYLLKRHRYLARSTILICSAISVATLLLGFHIFHLRLIFPF